MAEKKIGEVMKFFSKPSVDAVKITEGEINVGDSLKFSATLRTLPMLSNLWKWKINQCKRL